MAISTQLVPQELYQHYKGTIYRILAVACHTETLEEHVVYQDITEIEKIWIRPLEMFCENVTLINGEVVPRFRYINLEQDL